MLIESILYFQDSTWEYKSMAGLALRLGGDANELELYINQLVELNILEKRCREGKLEYRYVQPDQLVVTDKANLIYKKEAIIGSTHCSV